MKETVIPFDDMYTIYSNGELTGIFSDLLNLELDACGLDYNDDCSIANVICGIEETIPENLLSLNPFEDAADEVGIELIGNLIANVMIFKAHIYFLKEISGKNDVRKIELPGIQVIYGTKNKKFTF